MNQDKLAVIEMKNVGLYYPKFMNLFSLSRKKHWALKDVTFDLEKGETLGVVGRNGAGKSTLLLLMAGILKPDLGTIYSNTSKISLLSLQVGFVPYLSGVDNIILSGLLSGYSIEEIKEKMEAIIDFSGLDTWIHQPIHTYSTGMKARLGFSIAFFTDPDVLLVDETLGVGDARFQKKSEEKMKKRISSNKTVVLVSHSQAKIQELCDRVVWLENGQTVMQGPTKDVMKAYESGLQESRIDMRFK